MKKVYLLIALASLVGMKANAQSVSLRAGLNLANMVKSGDKDFETDFKPGFHAGLGLDLPIVSGFSFAPEILYAQKGYKVQSSNILGGDTEYTVTTNFIDVPILAKFKATGFNIHVGPQVSFLTSTTESWKKGSQTYRETIKEENANLRKSLVSGVIGIGLDVSSKVSLIGRYALDLQKNNEDGTSDTPQYRNQVIQIGLGIKL